MKNLGKIIFVLSFVFLLSHSVWGQDARPALLLPVGTSQNVKNWWIQYKWGSDFEPGQAFFNALSSRLSSDSRFMTVDRGRAGSITGKYYKSEVLSTEDAMKIGGSIGGRYVIVGNVGEFELVDNGRINVPIGDIKIGIGNRGDGRIRMLCSLDILEVSTGKLVSSVSSRKEITFPASSINSLYAGNESYVNGTPSTVIGKGVYEASLDLFSQLDRLQLNYEPMSQTSQTTSSSGISGQLEGYILQVDRNNKVYVNLTSRDGLANGDVLNVVRSERIKDPKTGRTMKIDKTVAELKVTNAGRKSSECKIMGKKNSPGSNNKYGSSLVKSGDKVVRQ